MKTTFIVIYTKTFRPKNIGLRWFKKLTKNTGYLTAHSVRARPAKCNERTLRDITNYACDMILGMSVIEFRELLFLHYSQIIIST